MAHVRFVNAISSTTASGVDIYFDATTQLLSATNFVYKSVSAYIKLTPGLHTLYAVVPGGSPTNPAQILATLAVSLEEHKDYTVVVSGTSDSPTDSVALSIYFDDNRCAEEKDHATLRFINSAQALSAFNANLYADKFVIFSNIAFRQGTDFVPAKDCSFVFKVSNTASPPVTLTTFDLHFKKRIVYTFILVGDSPNSPTPAEVLILAVPCHCKKEKKHKTHKKHKKH